MATALPGTQEGNNKAANDALNVLLQQLLNGGTMEMQQAQAARGTEVNRTRAQQARYSPEAAFADAQGLMAQLMRQAMEKNVATITRSAEGAGTSANSMRALLTQDALTRAAESAAAQGLNASANYGQIGASLAGVLERLTQPDNAQMEGLLSTIRLIQQGNEGGGGSSGGSRTGGGNVYDPNAASRAATQRATDEWFNRPGGILSNARTAAQTGMQYYGPTPGYTDQLIDTIAQGLGPSQSLSNVPNISDVYTSGLRF